MNSASGTPRDQGQLGTFAGVFTPSILTILGIILFLRLGYIVGSGGLGIALLLIGLANGIALLTSISLATVATNLKVRGGGDYYLISRTLGGEFGGALGIVLFLAQSVSIAFYCIGFGEVTAAMLPPALALPVPIIAAVAVLLIFFLAWLGADWATRFQYVVMALLALALLSFYLGGIQTWKVETLVANWSRPADGPGFWVMFAIFFPAVTGFTQGVSMSGDLRDAGRSLPLGTFLAVGLSALVYLSVALIFAGALGSDILRHDYRAMNQTAAVGFLIDAGVLAATLSSAMASFLGAPRILQSLAADRIFPLLLFFAKGHGSANNPRRGVLLSGAIALGIISLGNLNLVASVVSMFFLISYGLLNYATYYEARTASPSFRPRFRWFNARLSLIGALACLGVMLAINPASGIAAIAILFAIHQYLKRSARPARWADSRRSFHLQQVREHLLAAAGEPEHPRDWRPQILAFSDESKRRGQLLLFASWIEGGSGLTTAVRILQGEGAAMLKRQEEALQELRRDLNTHQSHAFPLVMIAPTLRVGVQTMVQAFGIGPIRSNTVLLNWFEHLPSHVLGLKEISYSHNLRTAFRLGANIIILDAMEDEWADLDDLPSNRRRIDVWWWNDATSRLMLLLAYLMTKHPDWEDASIRVLTAQHKNIDNEATERLSALLAEVRIDASAETVPLKGMATIVNESADAAMIFLPFRIQGLHLTDPLGDSLVDLLPELPIAALCLAAEDINLDATPEEGAAGDTAAIMDGLAEAKRRLQRFEKEADQATAEADKTLQTLEEAMSAGKDPETLAQLNIIAAKAAEHAKKMARRAAKAKAKADSLARELERLASESVEPLITEEPDD